MTPRDYMKSRVIPLLILLAALVLVSLMLWVFDLPLGSIAAIDLLLVLAVIAAFIWDYLAKRRFYTELDSSLTAESETFYISELLNRPTFYEGQLTYDAIEDASKDMNDRIALYRLASDEYREYIESWIHEVKTPIAASKLTLDNMLANQAETATRDVALSLESDLNRIESYVEQALYYSRSTAVEKDYLIKAVNLEALVKSVVKKQSRAFIEAGIVPHFENLDYTIYSDVKWLDFIIGQIVANAIKYRRPQTVEHTPEIRFTGVCDDTSFETTAITLNITDNGIGIPATDISRIFEKGFTGENGRRYAKSTGIGLYLGKKLSEKMKLRMTARSEQGSFTTISITFPLSKMFFLE